MHILLHMTFFKVLILRYNYLGWIPIIYITASSNTLYSYTTLINYNFIPCTCSNNSASALQWSKLELLKQRHHAKTFSIKLNFLRVPWQYFLLVVNIVLYYYGLCHENNSFGVQSIYPSLRTLFTKGTVFMKHALASQPTIKCTTGNLIKSILTR